MLFKLAATFLMIGLLMILLSSPFVSAKGSRILNGADYIMGFGAIGIMVATVLGVVGTIAWVWRM